MWLDNASDIDILFYEPYARIIADIAKNEQYNPLTVGVFGLWGAGKSTLLKLIGEKLKSQDDEIDISILAKLLVLQKLDNDLFIQLNEWNKEFDTENKEFKEIRTKVMEGKVDAQNPWNTSQIKKWLECKPVELEKYRLEKYFYLTRENLKRSSIDESGFSKNTKEILERIGRAKSGQMVAIIKDMEKLRAEEIADTFKVVVSKIEKGEMKFFVVRDLFLNFDAYKGKIVDAIGKSTVPIKAGDMAALRTMYNSDTGNMNTVLETMVKRGTLTDEQITEIKEQRKS